MSNPYYIGKKCEAWDVIDDYDLNFNLGNVIKYVLRFGRKTTGEEALQDLKKARDYLDREIEKLRQKCEYKKELQKSLCDLQRHENGIE